MGSNHLDHQADKNPPEMPSDSSMSSDSYDTSDIFEDPVVHPRVGDEYQAEVPPILSASQLLQLKNNPADCKAIVDSSHSFVVGLPIPVVWVYDHASSLQNEGFESENGLFAFPGLPTETWSDFEADCFLLGLYIFGKNLLQVKRFMESKDMGQILSYYYGQFHGSGAYRKWSECRKMRIKKCIVGERFLIGYRQQELLSRLLPRLSEESKTKLLEASRAFSEGITSLDEYVFSLKTLVGIRVLVEVVAIGKGKEDLTTLVMDSKNTQILTQKNHPDIPSRKACSSLTLPQIVKCLTGDFRLSKARSNDLFWEAIWPRLLARGWHSEQPRVDVYGGSKNGLVFLMPGFTKFSRRKLTKGDDYFDSVTDVLAKVASEPELLELESDETNKPACSKEENGWVLEEVNSDYGDNSSDHDERHCNYLKPRVSEGLPNLAKFTVVDTSLASEENPSKMRELRSLPVVDAKRSSNPSNPLRKAEKESKGNAIKHQLSNPKTKRRKLGSLVKGGVNFVLCLPARDKNAATKKNVAPSKVNQQNVKAKVASSDGKILEDKGDEKNANFSSENGKNTEPKMIIDLNLPQVPTENGINHAKVMSEEVENNPSDTKDAEVSSSVVGPNRRQSTRNRPLTTKALEALEIGFLNPVRHSRKRSSSITQDQKHSKRSYRSQNNESFVFSDIAGLQERAELSGLQKASCPPKAAA